MPERNSGRFIRKPEFRTRGFAMASIGFICRRTDLAARQGRCVRLREGSPARRQRTGLPIRLPAARISLLFSHTALA
jgi:hypothetical protein